MLPSNGGRRSPGLSCASVHELVSPVAILTQDLHFYPTGGRTESHSLNSLLRYIAFIVISQELQPPEVPMSAVRSEEHTSELQSLMRISYAVLCLKQKQTHKITDLNQPSPQSLTHVVHLNY